MEIDQKESVQMNSLMSDVDSDSLRHTLSFLTIGELFSALLVSPTFFTLICTTLSNISNIRQRFWLAHPKANANELMYSLQKYCTGLKYIELSNHPFLGVDRLADFLSSFRKLYRLRITTVQDYRTVSLRIPILPNLTKLGVLAYLHHIDVGHLKNLKTFICHNARAQCMEFILTKMPNLEELETDACFRISALHGLKKLRKFRMFRTKLMWDLDPDLVLSSLVEFSVYDCGFDDASLEMIVCGMPNLQELHLNSRLVSLRGLRRLSVLPLTKFGFPDLEGARELAADKLLFPNLLIYSPEDAFPYIFNEDWAVGAWDY